MNLRNFLKFLSMLGIIAAVTFAANFAVSAQKEHGKGHSKGVEERGDDDGDHGKGNNGNNGRWKGEDRQEHDERGRNQQQVWIVQQPRGEERHNNGNWQRQQVWNDRQSQERDSWERRQQQQVFERQRQIQRAQSEWNARRQQELNNRRQYQSDRQVYAYPIQGQPIGRNLWYGRQYDGRDDKQYRKEQKRAWKEERNFEKERRRYSRNDRRYSTGNYYDNNYNAEPFFVNTGSSWKEELLRVVLANVIGNRLGGDQRNAISQYAPVYNEGPYNQSNGRASGYDVPQFVRSYGTPYNQAYQPEYGDVNSSFGGNSITGQLLNSLPIAELIERYTGGNPFVSELVSNFLAQGYDEGYRAGNSARRNRYGDKYYQDPYVTADGIYDPFSVSMGENRQILSEGYDMGYQDALAGRTDYDPQSDGNVDLVSLLLNDVLGNI